MTQVTPVEGLVVHGPTLRHRRLAALLVATGLLGVSGALLVSSPASADTSDNSYDASADAYALDDALSNPSLPLGLVVQGSGPVASSHLTSYGTSDAFASFPYPGDTVSHAPGLVAGLFNLPVPAYPLIVSTSSGDAPQSVDTPGIALSAASGTATNEAKAVAGQDATGATSTTRIEPNSGGGITATADTVIKGVSLAGLLELNGIHSQAQVIADGSSGALTRSSVLTIGQISVPGLNLTIPATTPGTVPIPDPLPGIPQVPPLTLPAIPLPFGGTTIPTPDIGIEDGAFSITLPEAGGTQTFAIPAQPVLDAFKAAGVTITFQNAVKTDTGVVAPSVTFDMDLPSPPNNMLYNGLTHVSFTLGRATATVSYGVAAPSGLDSGGGLGTGDLPPATTPVDPGSSPASTDPGPASSAPPAPTNAAGGALLGGDPASALPQTGPGADTSSPTIAGTPTAKAQQANLVALRSTLLSGGAADIYLVLVTVALAVLISGTVLRTLGVRNPWTS